MNLSHYVVKTINTENETVFYNTVTHTQVPIDATEEVLRENFCLVGQERDAVKQAVRGWEVGDTLFLQVAPTWECNLRCKHCIVLDRLKKRDENQLDLIGLRDFAERFINFHGIQKINLSFYGGEPLSKIESCIETLDTIEGIGLPVSTSIVTNLAIPLTEQHFSLLSRLSSIGISLDGLETMHNNQRRSLVGHENNFEKTLENMRRLVLAGLKDKMTTKTCLQEDFDSLESKKEFLKTILQFGIKPANLQIGAMAPTKTISDPKGLYLKCFDEPRLTRKSCCRYQPQIILVDNTNSVFSDFYQYSKIGTIYDDIGYLHEQQIDLTMKTLLPIVDTKCQECPVVGYCWGGCSMLNCVRPFSSYCQPEVLMQFIQKQVEQGTLISGR